MENKELVFYIIELNKKIEKLMEQIFKKNGLTKIQALVLISINNKENNINCSVNDIVNELELNQGNTSSLLKRMESLELIEKVKSKDDERRVEIILTEKGKNKVKEIHKEVQRLRNSLNNKCDEVQRKQIVSGIKQLEKVLEFMCEEE